MSDKKISQLPASTTPLGGAEELAVVQSGDTKKVSIDNLTAGKTVPSKYLKSTGNNNNITIANFESAANGLAFEDLDTGTQGGQLLGPINWVSYDGSVVGNPRPVAMLSAVSESNFGNASITLFTGTQTQDPAAALIAKSNKDVEIPSGNLVIDTADKGVEAATGYVNAGAYKLSSSGIITEAGTTRTLSAADDGKVIYCTSGSAVTITCDTGLGAGFSCTIIQGGAGKVTVAAGGATLVSYSSLFSTMGQYAAIALVSPVADTFVATGNLGV